MKGKGKPEAWTFTDRPSDRRECLEKSVAAHGDKDRAEQLRAWGLALRMLTERADSSDQGEARAATSDLKWVVLKKLRSATLP